MENGKPDLKALSASRIKTYESCSWLYWVTYHLRLPKTQNDGAKKGDVCHRIFELLLNKKHVHHFNKIVKKGTITASKPIERLTKIYLKSLELNPLDEKIFQQVDKMILVGLVNDFFVKGGTLVAPEYKFDILNEDPQFYIRGFIDKPFIKNNKIYIDDFKSSKMKFSGEDNESNIQAMIYSLAAKKIWPDKKPLVRFIFLQFPDDPFEKIEFSDNVLKGFEYYLAAIQKKIDSFNERDSKANYAYYQTPKDGEFKGKIMCGFARARGQKKKDGNPMWHCPYKFPFDYYVIKKGGKILYSVFEEDKDKIKLKEGESIEFLHYNGCPVFNRPNDRVLDDVNTPLQTQPKKKYNMTSILDDL